MKEYKYGTTIIKSDLKFEFSNENKKFSKILDYFDIELKVYCGKKKIFYHSTTYHNTSVIYVIEDIFKKEVEKQCEFHKGYHYYAEFKVYTTKPKTRYKYIKTDILVNYEPRKYLLQERINISF